MVNSVEHNSTSNTVLSAKENEATDCLRMDTDNKKDLEKFDKVLNNNESKDSNKEKVNKNCADMLSKMLSKDENVSNLIKTTPQNNLTDNSLLNIQSLTPNINSDPTLAKINTNDLEVGTIKTTELIQQLVNQVLVSDPKHTTGSEVRITLNSNLHTLQGAEIVLRRDLEGLLALEINSKNQKQFKDFVNIRSDLQNALRKLEGRDVNIIINEDYEERDFYDHAIFRT